MAFFSIYAFHVIRNSVDNFWQKNDSPETKQAKEGRIR